MKNNKMSLSRVLIYLFLTIGAVTMIFPFYWMITGAFKSGTEIISFPPVWIPSSFALTNFIEAFERAPFLNYFINSLTAMVCSVSICSFTTIVGAFAFSKLNFPFKHVLLGLLLGLMMVPFEMIVITNFRTIIDIGLYDNILALIVPFTSKAQVADVFPIATLPPRGCNNISNAVGVVWYAA